MPFSLKSASVFVFACFAYGISSAVVKKGLTHFGPFVMIFYRMFFGLIPSVFSLLYSVFFDFEFRMRWKEYILLKGWDLFHICFTGFCFLGITYPCIGIALIWIPSHAEQIMHPIAAMVGAIVSHFAFHDEKFHIYKFLSIVISTVGLAMVIYPTMDHPGPSSTLFQIVMGYCLVFFAVCVFGVTSVYMKAKTIKFHPNVVTVYQMIVATIFNFIVTIFFEGHNKLIEQSKSAKIDNWIWPIIVGVVGTGLSQTAANYLVANVGATAVAFTGIGQVSFGVISGVIWLKEWAGYSYIEIIISMCGISIIVFGVIIGFIEPKHQEYEPLP